MGLSFKALGKPRVKLGLASGLTLALLASSAIALPNTTWAADPPNGSTSGGECPPGTVPNNPGGANGPNNVCYPANGNTTTSVAAAQDTAANSLWNVDENGSSTIMNATMAGGTGGTGGAQGSLPDQGMLQASEAPTGGSTSGGLCPAGYLPNNPAGANGPNDVCYPASGTGSAVAANSTATGGASASVPCTADNIANCHVGQTIQGSSTTTSGSSVTCPSGMGLGSGSPFQCLPIMPAGGVTTGATGGANAAVPSCSSGMATVGTGTVEENGSSVPMSNGDCTNVATGGSGSVSTGTNIGTDTGVAGSGSVSTGTGIDTGANSNANIDTNVNTGLNTGSDTGLGSNLPINTGSDINASGSVAPSTDLNNGAVGGESGSVMPSAGIDTGAAPAPSISTGSQLNTAPASSGSVSSAAGTGSAGVMGQAPAALPNTGDQLPIGAAAALGAVLAAAGWVFSKKSLAL